MSPHHCLVAEMRMCIWVRELALVGLGIIFTERWSFVFKKQQRQQTQSGRHKSRQIVASAACWWLLPVRWCRGPDCLSELDLSAPLPERRRQKTRWSLRAFKWWWSSQPVDVVGPLGDSCHYFHFRLTNISVINLVACKFHAKYCQLICLLANCWNNEVTPTV